MGVASAGMVWVELSGTSRLNTPDAAAATTGDSRFQQARRLLDQGPQIGQSGGTRRMEARHAPAEVRRVSSEPLDASHRTLLVQEIGVVEGEERLAEAGDRAKGATGDIVGVGPAAAMLGVLEREARLPEEAANQRLGQRRGIGLALPLERR